MIPQIMIDIETLDTAPSALVLSVGWAWFCPDAVLASGQRTFDLDTQVALGRTISPSTVYWWKDQTQKLPKPTPGRDLRILPAAIVASLVDAPTLDRNPIDASCMNVSVLAKAPIWANSPAFDLVILKHWVGQLRMAPFWSYRNERDLRTWRASAALQGALTIPDMPAAGAHDAEADAVWQANLMVTNRRFAPF